jgi:universal stress protein A
VFQHVLVPVDLSKKNEAAVAAAGEIAAANGGRVTLLHVIQTIEQLPFAELRRFYAALETTARKRLARHAARVRKRGVLVREVVAYGAPVAEIIRQSGRDGVDLVVLSSHKVGPGTPPRDWGTVSYRVAFLAPCPILLVK